MKENIKIQQLEKDFQDYEKSFGSLFNEYIERVKRTVYSKGWY